MVDAEQSLVLLRNRELIPADIVPLAVSPKEGEEVSDGVCCMLPVEPVHCCALAVHCAVGMAIESHDERRT